MIGEFGLDLSGLVLDMTNFATYIDSANDKADIAQRGHAKQKRTDLRLVGLGLVVSVDGGIPICSHPYPGNKPDVTQFADIVTELTRRWRNMAELSDELTLVYDAGQDSEANQAHIEATADCTTSDRSPHPSSPNCWPWPPAATTRLTPTAIPGLTAFDTRGVALGAERPPRRDPLAHPAHQTSAGIRPDPGHRPPPAWPSSATAWPGGKTAKTRVAVEAESPRSSNPAGSRVITVTLSGDGPATFALALPSTPKPSTPWPTSCSANASCSPTTTTGPWSTWWPDTAPSRRSRTTSGK